MVLFTQPLYPRLLICLFQYSDRFTPVLLIVSLAGIKVCSPDGKVSTRDADIYSYARGKGCRAFVCMRVVIEKQLVAAYGVVFQDGERELHFLREKFALFAANATALELLPPRVIFVSSEK